jgi:hypothetical protein
MNRNESIFQNIANDIRMSSERHLKFVLRTLYRLNSLWTILARGGGSQHILNPSLKDFTIVVDSIKTPMVHPYRAQLTDNYKITINNMFQEHTARRYLQGSTQKLKNIGPTYLAPIASTQIKNMALIGWTCFGVGLLAL